MGSCWASLRWAVWETTSCPASTLGIITSCSASVPTRWTGYPGKTGGAHHSFTVSPETFDLACQVFHERKIKIDHLTYRAGAFSPAGNCTSSTPAGTGWSCAIPPGARGCRSLRLKSWPGASSAPESLTAGERQMDEVIVFAVLALSLVLFVVGKWRYDIVAILALLVLTIAGIVPASEAYQGSDTRRWLP